MNINHFENDINKTILGRGYDYYIHGNIVETTIQGNNDYRFLVEGREDYEVVVKIDHQGEMVYSVCDCPFEGAICKHQVAAFYELVEMLNSDDFVKEELAKQPEIREVLNVLTKEELIHIIIDVTQKDTTLKNSLIVRYSKGDHTQELETCKRLLRSIVRKYTGRKGFIPYNETYGFVNEMDELVEKARNTDDILIALDIALLLLIEAVEAFQYADDSSGWIGSLVAETIKLIEELVERSADLDLYVREKIFHRLIEESEHQVFDEWDEYRAELMGLCVAIADREECRNKLKMKIEHMVSHHSGGEYKKYSTERMLHILFDLTCTYGTEEEAETFVKDHLTYSSFRGLLIDKWMKEKNYHKVIEVAREGEMHDKSYAGLVSRWKKIRYEAYKKLSLKEEQKRLAKELLFDGDFEYYQDLKELVTDDKTVFYQNLKQELNKEKGWHRRSIYLNLIEHEKDEDAIMEFVRENPSSVEEYARLLQGKFLDEVIEIYKRYIKEVASSSANRKGYQGVCGIIKRFKKIAGKEKQEEISKELIALYSHRPAFIDELSKMK